MAWVLAHLQRGGRETDSSKVVFNSETKCSMWAGPTVTKFDGRVSPSAAANTNFACNFEVGSSEELLENCASKGPPSTRLEAAARGVTSAGSAGSHRAPLAPTPRGWILETFVLTGSFSLRDFTFSYFLQCKRERWDRILAQVIFFNEVSCPPPLSASLSAGERGGLFKKIQRCEIIVISHPFNVEKIINKNIKKR